VVTICTTSLTLSILRSAHTVYLCVLYGSQNKQWLLPIQHSLAVFITERECLLCGTDWIFKYTQRCSREICGGKSGTMTGLSPSTSVSPVSIIPPLPHTHSFIYHRRCIMFISQYFSFPCQYHSTIAPYSFIHLPPTLYSVYLPVLQFHLSVSFHHCPIFIHSSTTDAV